MVLQLSFSSWLYTFSLPPPFPPFFCNFQLQETARSAEDSSQSLKSKLQAAISEEVSLVEQLQRLQEEKSALEEELASFKIDQSDSIWSLESQLLQCASERDALQAQDKELRTDLEVVSAAVFSFK